MTMKSMAFHGAMKPPPLSRKEVRNGMAAPFAVEASPRNLPTPRVS
jgi:hypothetical protein